MARERLRGARPRGVCGFTLVELLAVVAVTGVLVCVLVPAVSGGVMAGKRAQCAGNMREIGGAILMYAGENGGALPVTSHSTGDSRVKVGGQWVNTLEYSWIYVLGEYLGDVDRVRVCPADERERQAEILRVRGTSYLLNDGVFDSEVYGRLQGLAKPGRTAIVFISGRPVSRTWDHAHCDEWRTWGAVVADIAPDRHRMGARAGNRLKGSANYLYADGHVECIEAREMKRLVEAGVNPGAVPTGE